MKVQNISPLNPQASYKETPQLSQTHAVTPDMASRTVAGNDLIPNGQKVLKKRAVERDKLKAQSVTKVDPVHDTVVLKHSTVNDEEIESKLKKGYEKIKSLYLQKKK